MSMASCPLVRNSRSSGRPMTSDVTGSSMCSRAIHCRAPISECPVFSRTSDTCTVLIPFATRPAQPMYWRFTPAVAAPAFSWPVSSIAAITRPPRRGRGVPPRPGRPPEPADLAHRRERVPRRAVQQPLRPVRRPVPGMLGNRPAVPLRHLTDQRRHILPGMLPRLRPRRSTASAAPAAQPVCGPPAQPLLGHCS